MRFEECVCTYGKIKPSHKFGPTHFSLIIAFANEEVPDRLSVLITYADTASGQV